MPKAIELLAAALAVLYLVLAIRQRRSCWIAAFASSCLYVVVLFEARLYMESLLNGFYAVMAVYGYYCWDARGAQPARVHRWPLAWHLGACGVILLLATLNSLVLARYTPAAWPWVDSAVTWASVFSTWLVARKVYENWHWWVVIDAVTMCLSYVRGLRLTAALFAVYLVMIGFGVRAWRQDLDAARA